MANRSRYRCRSMPSLPRSVSEARKRERRREAFWLARSREEVRTGGMRLGISSLLLLAAAAIAPLNLVRAADNFTDTYDRLLKKYLSAGGVKYAAWKANAADMKDLQSVVDGIAGANVGSMSRNDQLAFYINAYNAWILHEALDKYPTKIGRAS